MRTDITGGGEAGQVHVASPSAIRIEAVGLEHIQ
jgi:hypothetical protein